MTVRSRITKMALCRILVCLLLVSATVIQATLMRQKRSFVDFGCMGVFDRQKFAKLVSVCDQCYEFYWDPNIHSACTSDCFKNKYFPRCVDVLLLSEEKDELEDLIATVRGSLK